MVSGLTAAATSASSVHTSDAQQAAGPWLSVAVQQPGSKRRKLRRRALEPAESASGSRRRLKERNMHPPPSAQVLALPVTVWRPDRCDTAMCANFLGRNGGAGCCNSWSKVVLEEHGIWDYGTGQMAMAIWQVPPRGTPRGCGTAKSPWCTFYHLPPLLPLQPGPPAHLGVSTQLLVLEAMRRA